GGAGRLQQGSTDTGETISLNDRHGLSSRLPRTVTTLNRERTVARVLWLMPPRRTNGERLQLMLSMSNLDGPWGNAFARTQGAGRSTMKGFFLVTSLLAAALTASGNSSAQAAPCLIVTLTGTQGGPQSFNGLAGAGTLVRYGDDANDCGAVKLQFDAGRGTTMRLSQIGIGPEQLNAVYFTHMHNDHTDGFADLVQLRWSFNAKGPKLD